MPYKFISEENLIKFLKEKMNYTYTTEELRDVFTYKESEKGYLDMISDSCQSNVTIKDGCYKLGNKYYITVNNEDNKEIELVLLENDNSYYFYSAKVKNIVQNNAKENNEQNSISNAEISEIENFINDFKNQAFALTNYDNPEDLLKHEQNMYNIDRILSYSIKQSNYAIPVPRDEDNKYPYIARATLCYFPECSRNQGVDYTNRELSLAFGRIVNDKGRIEDINSNVQDESGAYVDERKSRAEFRKWENTKFISTILKDRLKPKKSYDEKLWGMTITSKDRLSTRMRSHLNFGIVITLKELKGMNRIDDFIKACRLRGYIVNSLDVQQRIEVFNATQEEIIFD